MASHDHVQATFLGLANWLTGRALDTRQTPGLGLLDETALIELSYAGENAMERLHRLLRNQVDEDDEQIAIAN